MGRSKKNNNSPFAENLKKLLAERGITQKQAASLAEVGPSVINDWLNGTTPHDLTAVVKLAKALNCDFQYLLTSMPSRVENASLSDIFKIENEPMFSGIFEINARRLVRKTDTKKEDGNK